MRLFLLIIFYFIFLHLSAQKTYPGKYFRPPMTSEFGISSNFGEIRPSHFHAGLDYGTKKRIGYEVFAIADGYVSRVKVSSKGYGNAIYITHPNGYVSVYAHLSQFGSAITNYIYKVQHERQQFEIDDYLYPQEFMVKKGQVIGKTGNTGRSYGPHLHFEIRDEISEEPINPLYFGMKLPDNLPPEIDRLYMYQFMDGMENYKFLYSQEIEKPGTDTIKAFGSIGFGVEINDYMVKKRRRKDMASVSAYEIKLFVDDSLIFYSQMERISFDESKYLNSFVDYDLYRDEGIKISKCFIEPNNKLKIYRTNGNGLYNFSDGNLHEIRIVGEDIVGNFTDLVFYVQSDSTLKAKAPLKGKSVVKEIDYALPSEFSTDSFKIVFPEDAFYYNFNFKYSNSSIGYKRYSNYHHIHNQYVPIHNPLPIFIKPHIMPDYLKPKALIVGIGRNQRHFSVGGFWNNEFLEGQISSFGTYYVDVDTINPVIKPITLKETNFVKSQWIRFSIKDHLSGIDDYVAYIDDNFVLFEYDEKNDLISCNLKAEHIEPGEHELVLWVRDKVGNIETYESIFNF